MSNLDLELIKAVGYPTMFFLMIVEGPIATLLAAFAASLGFFNIFIVFILSMAGDIIGDVMLYSIGYFGGMRIINQITKFLRIKKELIEKIRKHFTRHGKRTIFAVKSTTGLCWITFLLAGSVKMDFVKFLSGSFWGGIIWSSFLVVTGYFFGYAFEQINNYITYAGLIIFCTAIIFYTFILLYKKYQTKHIFRNYL